MSCMFSGCESLINLNLSRFNIRYAANMNYMFDGCKSLNRKGIITKNEEILNVFKHKQ